MNRYFPGGQTTHVQGLADTLAEAGYATVLVYLTPPPLPRAPELWRVTTRGNLKIVEADSLSRLHAIARSHKPDLIHAHSVGSWPEASSLASRLSIPYILTAHGPGVDNARNRSLLAGAAAVVVPGLRTRASLRSLPAERILLVPNGVDLRRFKPGAKKSPPSVAYVGRVDRSRLSGFQAFLEATRDLDAEILVLANARPRPEAGHVRYLGWRHDTARLMPGWDVVAGIGRSLREGLASGAAGIVLGRRLHGLVLPETMESLGPDAERGMDFSLLPSVGGRTTMTDHLRTILQELLAGQERLRSIQRFSRRLAETHFDATEWSARLRESYEVVVREWSMSPTESERFGDALDPEVGKPGSETPHPPAGEAPYEPPYLPPYQPPYQPYELYGYEGPRDREGCTASIKLDKNRLCLGVGEGEAGAQTTASRPTFQWDFSRAPGLRLLPGYSRTDPIIKYRATAYGCQRLRVRVEGELGEKCSADARISVPQPLIVTGSGRPARCVGLISHAPRIDLQTPAKSGDLNPARVTALDGAGETMESFSASFVVSGRVQDPLGMDGLILHIRTSEGVTVPADTLILGPTGEFSFDLRVERYGLKTVLLACAGQGGELGLMLLRGFITFSSRLSDELAPFEDRYQRAQADYAEQAHEYFKTAGGGAGSPDPDAFSEEELNRLQQQLRERMDGIDQERRVALARLIGRPDVLWVAGANAESAIDLADALYRIRAEDCTAEDLEKAGILDAEFEMEKIDGLMISTKPQAFLARLSDEPSEPFPGNQNVVLLSIPTPLRDKPLPAIYRSCEFTVDHFRVRIEDRDAPGSLQSYVFVAHTEQAAGRTPPTTSAYLRAFVEGSCEDNFAYRWRTAYGPDPNSAVCEELENGRICRFTATVPGLYILEARAAGSHENPLAVGRYQVEVLQVRFRVTSDEVQTPEDEEGNPLPLEVPAVAGQAFFRHDLQLTSDGGLAPWLSPPGAFRAEVRWSGSDRLLSSFSALSSSGYLYDVPWEADSHITVAAELVAVVYAGRRHDVSLLGLRDEPGLIRVVPGPPDSVEVRLISAGGANELRRPLYPAGHPRNGPASGEFPSDEELRQLPARAAGNLGGQAGGIGPRDWAPWDDFAIGDPTVMRVSVKAFDRNRNAAGPGTPVDFELFGPGELKVGPAGQSLNERSEAFATFSVTREAIDKSLVKITVGEHFYLVGTQMAGAQFQLDHDAVNNVPTAARDDDGVMEVRNLEGLAEAALRVSFQDRPMPVGTRVALRISDGSIKTELQDRWSPDAVGEVRLHGNSRTPNEPFVRFWIRPQCFNADGSRHLLKFDAWGDVNLHVSIGESPETGVAETILPLRFAVVQSVREVPRWKKRPFMTFVRFEPTGAHFVPRPADRGPVDGQLAVLPTLQGEPGREALVELKQELLYRVMARFPFTGAPLNAGLNQPTPNTAPASNFPPGFSLDSRLQTWNLNDATAPGALSQAASLAGHASWVRLPVPSPDDRAIPRAIRRSLQVEQGYAASLAYDRGIRYAAQVPGSAGFELSCLVLGNEQRDWEVVRLEGTNDTRELAARGGFLSISYQRTGGGRIVVEYEARGCQSRDRVRPRPIVLPCRKNAWRRVVVRVEPALAGDDVYPQGRIDLSARIEQGPSASPTVLDEDRTTGAGFNYLPGEVYYLSLGVPDRGAAHLDDLQYSIPAPSTLQLIRPSDQLPTAWLMLPFEGTDERTFEIENVPPPGWTPPAIPNKIAPYATLTLSYCDTPDRFEVIPIAAIDEDAAEVFRYLGDSFNGVLFGESRTVAGFAGEIAAGMLGWGDLRDVVKNLAYAVPGGQEPRWTEFWLSLAGLALDVAQIAGGVAAAPNAVLAVIKSLLARISRDGSQAAIRNATFLGDILRKVLIIARDDRFQRAGQAAITLLSMRELKRQLALESPDILEFIDYFFEDPIQENVETVIAQVSDLGRRVVLPPGIAPLPFQPAGNPIADVGELAGGAAQAFGEVVLVMARRVNLFLWFFNPLLPNVRSIPEVARRLRWLRNLIPAKEMADQRVRQMLNAAENWKLPRHTRNWSRRQQRQYILNCFKLLNEYIARNAQKLSAQEIRTLAAVTAVSGPHRALYLVQNLQDAAARADYPPRAEVFQLIDFVIRKATEGLPDLNNVRFEELRPRMDLVSGLLSRLGVRNHVGGRTVTNWPAYSGAVAELQAIFRLRNRVVLRRSVDDLGREAWDLNLKGYTVTLGGREAAEVKSMLRSSTLKSTKDRLWNQFLRWAEQNHRKLEEGRLPGVVTDLAGAAGRPQDEIITELTYVLRLSRSTLSDFAEIADFIAQFPELARISAVRARGGFDPLQFARTQEAQLARLSSGIRADALELEEEAIPRIVNIFFVM